MNAGDAATRLPGDSRLNCARRRRALGGHPACSAPRTPLLAVPGVVAKPHEDNLRYFSVELTGPADTPYAGGRFLLELYCPDEYPMQAPVSGGHHDSSRAPACVF